MNKYIFTAFALLVAACSGGNSGSGGATSPGTGEAVPGATSLCLGSFGTNNPNINNHKFVIKAAGACEYSYEAFPTLSYACAYTVDDIGVMTVIYGPVGTQLSWAAAGAFAEDCSAWQTNALGLEMKKL